ncbi:Cu(I)-responsive transcriptional regulator [Lacibacterium aquatile]|uniref:Cu(I)-responsive transcriptional regulator n=1 Tax=Lacibacterium aquatile TaxID=1168082 RepID=A0ABW5DRH1_9PROT
MNIGEAAKATGVSTKMIRYYESIGLIGRASRTHSGYRLYSQRDLHGLRFIRRARDLGFAIEDIRNLLALWDDRERSSAEVKRIALNHMDELEKKIQEMEAMRQSLKHLADSCHGDHRPDCPIIEDLGASQSRSQMND